MDQGSKVCCLPIRGPKLKIAIAEARSRSANMSPIDPLPIAIGALPEKPAEMRVNLRKGMSCFYPQRKRKPMSAPVVGANAQPRLKPMVKIFAIWRT